MFNPQQITESLLPLVGGRENISEATCCMTRLRITLNDPTKVNKDLLKKVSGVLGVVESGQQLQLIFGPGKVNQVLSSLTKVLETKSAGGTSSPGAAPDAKAIKAKLSQKNSTPFKSFLKKIANVLYFISIILITSFLIMINLYPIKK